MNPFDDLWDIFHMSEEVNAIARQEHKKQMGKATFWLVVAFAIIVVLGKVSTMNEGG